MSLTSALNLAASSLANTQFQISTVSTNIANASTPGATQETYTETTPDSVGAALSGGTISRLTNSYLSTTVNQSASANAASSTVSSYLSSYDNALGSTSNDDTISNLLATLQSALTTLQSNPSASSNQTAVVAAASNIATNITSLSSSIQSLRTQTNTDIGTTIASVNTDLQNNGLQALLTYDRPTAARLGLTPQAMDSTLYDAFGQSEASTIYTPLNQYYVVLEVAPQYWASPEGLKHTFFVPESGGGPIPTDTVLKYAPSTSPLAINHTGLSPSVTVSFNLAQGVSLGQATKEIEDIKQQLGIPDTVHGQFAGAAQAFLASLNTEWYLIGTAIVAVYIVLGMLYESLVHPITILSTLPSASLGAMLALLLTRTELDVMSIIGIILLIGIVKKNAIMMIDFALQAEREQGMNTHDSIFEACMLRFRPILMTTMAALFGAVPLAVGTGMGSELRRPLGISIIGGLLVSQVLTLYTTPVIYLFMDNLRLKIQGDKHARLFTSTATSR